MMHANKTFSAVWRSMNCVSQSTNANITDKHRRNDFRSSVQCQSNSQSEWVGKTTVQCSAKLKWKHKPCLRLLYSPCAPEAASLCLSCQILMPRGEKSSHTANKHRSKQCQQTEHTSHNDARKQDIQCCVTMNELCFPFNQHKHHRQTQKKRFPITIAMSIQQSERMSGKNNSSMQCETEVKTQTLFAVLASVFALCSRSSFTVAVLPFSDATMREVSPHCKQTLIKTMSANRTHITQ